MDTNKFDPLKYGATKVQPQVFDPMKFGAKKLDSAQAGLAQSQTMHDTFKRQQVEQENMRLAEEAKVAQAPKTIAKETGKGSVNTILGPLVKAGRSAVQAVGEAFGGTPKVGTETYTDFAGNQAQTLQKDVEEGKSVGRAMGEFGLEAASILPIGKAVSLAKTGAVKIAEEAPSLINKIPGVSKVTSLLEKRAAKKTAEKETKMAMEAITPKTDEITGGDYEDLLRQKRVTPKTKTEPPKYILSEGEKSVASKYKNLLNTGDPVRNSNNLLDEIAKKDDEVGEFLRANNGIFNSGELKNDILEKLKDVNDISIPETRVAKLKANMADNFIKSLEKNDMESLWQARKAFDQEIERSFSGSPTLQNKVKREFRNAIQDFIADRTPDDVYKTSMKEMRDLFRVQENVANIATKQRGDSGVQTWIKNNPLRAGLIGLGISTAGGAVGAVGYGALKN